ncbi:hypothetical protein HanRHA438_Chr02g0059661 [Helianthus annuus]|uniref:Uncharacterized protein n=1 Tax=Helianthus annuus TaxID=4232 RepID=A0A251VGN7_HELAN|nr:hypothetical protein HanXRQr2_Chr02g0057711 [Helianthus annuus]KAJ0939314.1 hypothetical protein HanRHA438_Chr02g0059661 [Helianthus annuus]KAJ0951201.1 hypothetical protein HanPSC8_Chr02g0057161 [Helianthus annuus]
MSPNLPPPNVQLNTNLPPPNVQHKVWVRFDGFDLGGSSDLKEKGVVVMVGGRWW